MKDEKIEKEQTKKTLYMDRISMIRSYNEYLSLKEADFFYSMIKEYHEIKKTLKLHGKGK